MPTRWRSAQLPHDFLKIDCEGVEYDILRPTSWQALEKIDRICLEYHDSATHQHPELVEILTAACFSVRLTPSRASQAIGFLYA